MSQSYRHSIAETVANIVVGYAVNLWLQVHVFPRFHIHVDIATNVEIGAIFTVTSFLRGFGLRRIFNWFARLKSIRASGALHGERF
jgi:uncharacterized membrane protein (DUF485 family)